MLLHHLEQGEGSFGLEPVVRVVDEVASGPKFTIFVLMIVPTHLLSKGRLMKHQFIHSMREKAIISVHAHPALGKTLAELQLPLVGRVGQSLIIHHFCTHNQFFIFISVSLNIYLFPPSQTPTVFRAIDSWGSSCGGDMRLAGMGKGLFEIWAWLFQEWSDMVLWILVW